MAAGGLACARAIALALSFLVAAPLCRKAELFYDKLSSWLHRFETPGYHPDDLPVHLAGERIAIFGMGRVGLAAYNVLEERFPHGVIGFDRDAAQVELHRSAGRNVVLADATDSDFWERVQFKDGIDLARIRSDGWQVTNAPSSRPFLTAAIIRAWSSHED
jgi:lactate dehydrogenase-like 2-hydroxyacid dehydrogenase